MTERKRTSTVTTGAEAVAHAAKACQPQVVAAYPITPQTHIIEKLAEYVAQGELEASYIRVESEMSALAVVAGAVAQGVRAFTATSSQGLLFMHEMMHWAAGGRLPVVMAVANRAVGAPWNIWCDQQDALSQRDTGWMQVFASSAQEAMDLTIVAFRVAEQVFLPSMVNLDGFVLSHTAEPVELVEIGQMEDFLPPLDFPLRLSHHDPFTLWPILEPGLYHRERIDLFKDHAGSLRSWMEAWEEWQRITGRHYAPVEGYHLKDASTALLASGALTGTVRRAVDKLRIDGEKVGLVVLRLFRPFPYDHLREALAHLERVLVLDRAVSYGAEGVFSQEVRSALGGLCPVQCCIASMGGREVTPQVIEDLYYRSTLVPEGVVLWS
jgi:pyruvate/2-oxoacid:ferredoxin oxidoreductase alpha subunit